MIGCGRRITLAMLRPRRSPAESPTVRLTGGVRFRRWFAGIATGVVASLTLASCGMGGSGPVEVVVLSPMQRSVAAAATTLSTADRVLLDSVAGPLVRFGRDGQIEPALADRWTVIDNGQSYIFRLSRARWSDGRRVNARDVAAALNARLRSARARPAMRGEFADVESVRALTDSVVEVRLRQPRSDVLDLLAQSDVAILRERRGWGPFALAWDGATALLRPQAPPGADPLPADAQPAVRLRGGEPRRAVTRFAANDLDAVLGGKFDSWPYVAAARIAEERVTIDRAPGLFGLAVVSRTGALARAEGRRALAMAIDRERIVTSFGANGWEALALLRRPRDGTPAPGVPQWIDAPLAERRTRAAAAVTGDDHRVPLRIALGRSPGERILYARLRADLARIGVDLLRVEPAANADLRLIDDLAPSDDPLWPMRRLGCGRGPVCNDAWRDAMAAIAVAPDAATRAQRVTEAESALLDDALFIPLATPWRWALSTSRAGIIANARGRHSLTHLAAPPN